MTEETPPVSERRAWGPILYPALVLLAVFSSALAMQTGAGPWLHTGVVIVAFATLTAIFERVRPGAGAQGKLTRETALNLAHSLVSSALIAPAVRISLLVLLVHTGSSLSESAGLDYWPRVAPTAVQVVLAILIADLGAYGVHRLMHATRTTWRIHALHHSAPELDFLAAGRAHPFNAVLTLTAENGLLIALGVPPEIFALTVVFKATNGLLQHSNVAMRNGILSRILATNEVHHLHHSRDPTESNSNFGNTTMLWDQLFGTYLRPERELSFEELGVEGLEMPSRYLAHLASPFTLDRLEADKRNTWASRSENLSK